MTKKLIVLNLVLISSLNLIKGQEVVDIRTCISTGLERNYSILIARNKEEVARNNYTLGNAGYLPTLDLNSRYSGTVNNINQTMNDGTEDISKGIHNTVASAGLSLGMTIFNGFNVRTTYKKLDELKQIGELSTQMSIENYLSGMIAGYFNIVLQVQLLDNMRYAVALSKERLRIDEDRYLLGSSSKLQVLQSRVYLNADSSRLSRQYEVVRAAQIKLNELMAIDDLSCRFDTKDTTIEITRGLLYEKLLDETLASNTSLRIAAKNRTISEYDYLLVSSRSYPYVNLSSGYNYNFNTYSQSSLQSQLTNGLSYGLTMGVNIFDGNNQRRNLKNSSIDIRNKELAYLETEQGIRADLLTIYNAYTNYLRLIELEQQNLQTARENLEIAMERYMLGSLSGIELREVQKSLLDANESLISIKYQAKLAEISLMLISGRIMDYY